MEAIVTPMTWLDFHSSVQAVFQSFRSPNGEPMMLE
jgi:haloalkane dehalogenase